MVLFFKVLVNECLQMNGCPTQNEGGDEGWWGEKMHFNVVGKCHL